MSFSKSFAWLAVFAALLIAVPGCASDSSNDNSAQPDDANTTEEPEQYGSGPRD